MVPISRSAFGRMLSLSVLLALLPAGSLFAAQHPGEVLLRADGDWSGVRAPRGDWLWPAQGNPLDGGWAWLDQELVRRGMTGARQNFVLQRSGRDFSGALHMVLDQRYKGLPLLGQSLQLHFDKQDRLQAVNGRLRQVDAKLDLQPALSLSAALAEAYSVDRQWEPELIQGELAIHAPQWLG